MTVYVAAEHDHETQDTECCWCFEPLAQAPYVYGPNLTDVYHRECWDDVTRSTPQTG